ncbi:MAG TPA: hypothetical protein VFV67_11180 [Actinophytocola sp.]|uniref:hypothetical protein n=1 Tax=Actinophytocola sp. TaxID=1872138 RepID=UPI002DBD671E|nr:hypothetical protein [Actinophytocola sp.]HEU5471206.1 hypothetical protein [Actinophytocola sp.]
MRMVSWLGRPPPGLGELHPDTNRATLQALVIALPRMLRNTMLPGLTFLAGAAVVGVELGAVLACLAAASLFVIDRRAGRAGFIALLVMVFVFLSAAVAVVSRSLPLFFLPVAGVDLLMGSYTLVTVLIGRPLFTSATPDFLSVPAQVKQTPVYLRTARDATVLAGCYFLVRSLLRLAAFVWLPPGWFIAAIIVGEVLGDILVVGLAIRLNIRRLRPIGTDSAPVHGEVRI